MFWVISVYFNLRNTLPKFGTFLLGHPVYIYIYIYRYAYICMYACLHDCIYHTCIHIYRTVNGPMLNKPSTKVHCQRQEYSSDSLGRITNALKHTAHTTHIQTLHTPHTTHTTLFSLTVQLSTLTPYLPAVPRKSSNVKALCLTRCIITAFWGTEIQIQTFSTSTS